MYPQGYFRQRIPSHGWQEAIYQQLTMKDAPIQLVKNNDGQDLKVQCDLAGRPVYARVWYVMVGQNPLVFARYGCR
jgi:starch phosphorylase